MQTLALLLLASPAPQASELVATHVVDVGAAATRAVLALAHPEGGVIAVARLGAVSPSSAATSLRVRRLGENGDLLWATDATAGLGGSGYLEPATCVLDDGGVAIGFELAQGAFAPDVSYVVRLAPDGQVLWTRELSSSGPNQLQDLGPSPAGDVLVGGSRAVGPFASSGVATALDAATGAVQWERTYPASEPPHVLCEGGRVLLGVRTSSFLGELICLDAAGAEVYVRPEPVESQGDIIPLAADETGRALVRISWLGPDLTQELTPSGTQAWSQRFLPGSDQLDVAGTLLSGGGAAVVAGIDAQGNPAQVGRADASGAVLWENDLTTLTVPERPAIAEVAPGRIAVPAAIPTGSSGTLAGAAVYDADTGALLETIVPPSSGGAGDTGATVVRDERGNTWLGSTATIGSTPRARFQRFVSLGDPSVVSCTSPATNSIGCLSRLSAAGTDDVAADNLTLVASDLPAGVTVLFLNGPWSAFVPNPGGSQGTLCLGGTLGRYTGPNQVRMADAAGRAALQLDLPETPRGGSFIAVQAGQSVHFQAWHRDTVNSAPTSNFTNAIRVDFQ